LLPQTTAPRLAANAPGTAILIFVIGLLSFLLSDCYRAFRRGLATNLHRLGVPDVTIQRILRHSNVAVTQACYIKTASDESKAAMQKLETALTNTQVVPSRLLHMKPGRA
jgi:hypothetical protein